MAREGNLLVVDETHIEIALSRGIGNDDIGVEEIAVSEDHLYKNC